MMAGMQRPNAGVFGKRPAAPPPQKAPLLDELSEAPALITPPIQTGILTLIPSGQATLTTIHPSDRMGASKTFHMPDEIDAAAKWAVHLNNGGWNLYICANQSNRVDCKYRKNDITVGRFCWADIDPKVDELTSYAEAKADLIERVLPLLIGSASVVVGTGNGLQAYFRIDPPLNLADPATMLRYETVNAAIGKKYEGPSTHNTNRILRIPGTLNYPNAAKLKKGYPEEPSRAAVLYESDKTYSIEALEELTAPKPPIEDPHHTLPPEAPPELEARFKSFLDGNQKAKARYEGDASGLNDSTGSGFDFSMVAMMKPGGFGIDEIRTLLQHWEHGSKSGRGDGQTQDRYWERCFKNTDANDPLNSVASIGLFNTPNPDLFSQANPEPPTQPLAAGTGVAVTNSDAPNHPGDIRNGRAFAFMCRQRMLFVKPMGRWFRWDGFRWAICLCGEEIEAAKGTAHALLIEAGRVAAIDPDTGKRLFNHALLTQNLPRLLAMITLASSEPGMVIGDAGELDADPWLLGVRNGVVNLKTGDLLNPDPAMLITKQCHATYDPKAKCERWLDFLDDLFPDDPETIESIQRLLGYSLTGITNEEIMIICYGFGSNGKSVFINVISNVVGEYFTIGPNCLLVARDSADTSVRNDIAKLLGARLVSVNELKQGARLDEQIIKQLAGREPMSARFLYKDFFDFMPTGKVWLRTNHKPVVMGEDDGIWRRLVLIPFKQKFTGERIDIHLEQKLLAERDGILAWMVKGALKWQQHGGLMLSTLIRAESLAYRKESDLLGEFLDDTTTPNPNERADQQQLFLAWTQWCVDNGLKAGSKKRFTNKLAERGFREIKSNGQRFYGGLKYGR